MNEDGHEYDDYRFSKMDNETVLIQYEAPIWMQDVDSEELEQTILNRLHLKMDWIEDMPCNG